MIKNKYFKVVEEIAKELDLPCNKHNPHGWTVPHSQTRFVTFYHKVLFLKFKSNGTYHIESCCDMDFETFNTLFNEMKKFIKKVKGRLNKK